MAENYEDRNLEELKELARERDLKGRSSMDKAELAKALEDDDKNDGSDSAEASEEEVQRAVDQAGTPGVGHDSEASDPQDEGVVENLSDDGQEALEDMGEDSESAELADLALDASGPLHLESPYERIATGAVNEEHAAELRAEAEKLPDDWQGDFPEKVSDEFVERAKAANEAPQFKRQQDVIDFPPPLHIREQQLEEEREARRSARQAQREEAAKEEK